MTNEEEERPLMPLSNGEAAYGVRRSLLRHGMLRVDDLLSRTDLLLPDRRKLEQIREVLKTLHDQKVQDRALFFKWHRDILWMVKEHQRLFTSLRSPIFTLNMVEQLKIQDALLEFREREKGILGKEPDREAMMFVAEKLGLRTDLGIGVLNEDQLEFLNYFWPRLSFL